MHRNQERKTKAKKSRWCDAVDLTSIIRPRVGAFTCGKELNKERNVI